MRNFSKTRPKRKFYYINYRIEAPQLRVIAQDGAQIGILTKYEAIRQAQMQGLDLVLIAPNAKPPVAKIINFRKFLYQEEKKEKEAKKGIKRGVVKDLKISLFIAKADLERLTKRAKEFLDKGHQVRINLTLKGREITKKPMAFDLVAKFIASLGEIKVTKEPKLMGRIISAVVSRKK